MDGFGSEEPSMIISNDTNDLTASTTTPDHNRKLLERIIERTNLGANFGNDELDVLANEISSCFQSSDSFSFNFNPLNSNTTSPHTNTPSTPSALTIKDSETISMSPLIPPIKVMEEEYSTTTGITSLVSTPKKGSPNELSYARFYEQISELKLEVQKKKIELEKVKRECQIKIADIEEEKERQKHTLELELLKNKTLLEKNEKTLLSLQKQSQINMKVEEVEELAEKQIEQLKQEHKESTKKYKEENEIISDNLKTSNEKLEKLQREYDHIKRIHEEMKRDYKLQIEMLENKTSKITEELNLKTKLFEEIKAKGEMYDTIKTKATGYEEEYNRCRHELEISQASLKIAKDEKDSMSIELTNLKQQVELLKNDKMYLNREIETLTTKSNKSEEEIDRLENKVQELKKEKKSLYDKLLLFKEDTKTDYEKNLQEEIKKIRDKTKKDLELIKTNAQEAFERENRMLKEAKDAADSQVEKLRSQVEEMKESNSHLLMEYRSLQSTLEKQLSELRSQHSMKTFESERLQVSLMETSENLKQSKAETEVLKKKVEVLKTEYYTLQNNTGKRISELEAKLEASQKEVSAYKDLEKDLDRVIEEYTPSNEENQRILNEVTTMVPTSLNRRVKYSLYLTRRVAELEKTIKVYEEEFTKKEQHIQALTERLNKTKQHLDTASQPYNYLVAAIENKDKELETANKHIKLMEKELRKLKKENSKLHQLKSQLEKDIEQLLQQKNVTTKLKGLLLTLKEQQESSLSFK
ncbi:hypothetical protein ABK040_009575 [Willaertia magna]